MDRAISVIGSGRIGASVIAFVERTPGFRLSRVLTRSGSPDTDDPEKFLSAPADVIIDTAGPQALRQFGPGTLASADLWTVGATALSNDAFRRDMTRIAAASGTRLRLFSPWIPAIADSSCDPAARLHIRAARPGVGSGWSGPLGEAVSRFPDDLNSAMAAALCGPGIGATTIEFGDSGAEGPHRIEAELVTAFGRFLSVAEFRPEATAIHPTAASIIGALDNERRPVRYG